MYITHHKQASYYSGSQDNVGEDSVNDDNTSSNNDERTHDSTIDKQRELFKMNSKYLLATTKALLKGPRMLHLHLDNLLPGLAPRDFVEPPRHIPPGGEELPPSL